ncbi:flavin-containing monooxygenase [Nocardia sp. CA-135953]|uniref:flavin-containing monooxygenase n=1 Tax=Nocardia sp. CA-135953 TaxID=3239978 RepID=UPI003D9905C0
MSATDVDAIVVGAGFAGLHLVHSLREKGLLVRAFERGDGVGGTWFWNRYPGARCDAESVYYSYSFDPEIEQEWTWSEKYATQPEIRSYLDFVADRLDLRRDITFETTVTAASFDESTGTWTVRTNGGEEVTARYVVMATGCLSAGRRPDIAGIDDFTGEVYHTGSWPRDGVDLTGKRVAVIGTGSSGIQAIPQIATRADHLTVFQRTPNFSVPARNSPLDPDHIAEVKANYPDLRERSRWSGGGSPTDAVETSALEVTPAERQARYEEFWQAGGATIMFAYADIMTDKAANDTLADFIRGKIDEIVEDPELARLLKPHDHPVGTKRICVDTDYYATYNRDNVSLVDLRTTPIEALTANGIRTTAGDHDLDVIVFATGFDAMTGALNRIDIVGRDGASLRDRWRDGPKTYLGVAVHGFPKLFLVTGPGSPSVLSNVVTSIEQHVEWIVAHIEHLEKNELDHSEADEAAQERWVAHVNETADATLYPQANSWYLGANIPGKPRVFMPYVGGVGAYREKCDEVARNNYEGFILAR